MINDTYNKIILDVNNVEEYWEMLSVYPNGYEDIKSQWNRISSLHKIILEFARTHLSHKYGINLTETIPAHLLGIYYTCKNNSLK